MRKLILLCLFVIGLGSAIFGFLNFQGLAVKGEFETILLDFREDIPSVVVEQNLQAIAKQYNVTPQLDNKFSKKDNVYIIKGDRQRLQELKKSQFAQATEFIEPNYIYSKIPQPGEAAWLGEFLRPQEDEEASPSLTGPNDQYYSKQWNLHKIGVEGAWSQTKGSGITVAVIDTGVASQLQ